MTTSAPTTQRRHRALIGGMLAVVVVVGTAGSVTVGRAAGVPVASARLSTFQPSELPECAPTQTLIASADTWVNQAAPTTAYGSDAQLVVRSYAETLADLSVSRRNARALIRFDLPAVPVGCSLAAATLRLDNSAALPGRTISVLRAGAAWAEASTTWTSRPPADGVAVDATAATGWMQWTVTSHVVSMYTNGNNGFIARDAAENSTIRLEQQFSSRSTATPPELVLEWQ